MLDKIKNYAEHYENEVRDISNQLRDEMMPELSRELFDEYEITGNRLRYKATSREESFYLHLALQV